MSDYVVTASQMACFTDCKEKYRQKYVELREPISPNINLYYGTCFHKSVEMFWLGKDYKKSHGAGLDLIKNLDQSYLSVKDRDKWQEMTRYFSDMFNVYWNYWDGHQEDCLHSEQQFGPPPDGEFETISPVQGVKLAGKIDRTMLVGCLNKSAVAQYDLKTLSAMNKEYRENWKYTYTLDWGIRLYDWVNKPDKMWLEAIKKPYRNDPAEVILIELPEVVAWRSQFEFDLKLVLTEMKHYLDNYSNVKPWPKTGMSHGCVHKYGTCEFIKCCMWGETPKTLEPFKRREHLNPELVKLT